ncbi:kinase-like domain-containing protein [Ganoderma leucocontextum]|nr:kinase-like domain-containing protein [Ganoderma leucocontextum]
MAPSHGFFVFHNDGPHYIYLTNDDFSIGTGEESDCRVSVDGWEAPQGKDITICRVVRRRPRSQTDLLPHLNLRGILPVQLGTELIQPKRYHLLKQGDIVRIPKRMIFAKYHFTRISGRSLGSGGFGIVHEAIGVVTMRRHAIKVICKARCLASGTSKDPIQNEVDILRALNHPYIVTLDSVFQEGSYLFTGPVLVMELVAEGSLHDLIVREGRLNESDSRLVVLDICSALTNILIRSRAPLSVKISDFGLAKLVEGGTDLRTTCGTLDFMAPEIKPMKAYDLKVDTWAVGVTLFAMLSANSPFVDRARGTQIEWTRLPADISKLGMDPMLMLREKS